MAAMLPNVNMSLPPAVTDGITVTTAPTCKQSQYVTMVEAREGY
jgi:hypothetical protein